MRKFFLFLLFLAALPVFAKSNGSSLKENRFVFYVAGNMQFSMSQADNVSGASYSEKMNHPFVGALGFGVRALPFLYIGTRYENWWVRRNIMVSGVNQIDRLAFQTIAAEAGFYTGNPRVHWLLTFGYQHPLQQEIQRSAPAAGNYQRSTPAPSYETRLTLSVKTSTLISIRFEGGYRMSNLGDMTASGTSFLPGEELNMSGPFIGLGLGFHF